MGVNSTIHHMTGKMGPQGEQEGNLYLMQYEEILFSFFFTCCFHFLFCSDSLFYSCTTSGYLKGKLTRSVEIKL